MRGWLYILLQNHKKSMNRIVNISVTIIFLAAFIGVQINKHYSNGRLYSVAIFSEPETCCDDHENCDMVHSRLFRPGQTDKNDCSCKDEKEVLRIRDVFVSEKFTLPNIQQVVLFMMTGFETAKGTLLSNISQKTLYSLPPATSNDLIAGTCRFLC